MTNIRIYQRLRYYFSYAIQFTSYQLSNLSVIIFFLSIVFGNILTIQLLIRNTRLIQALAIPIGVPMTLYLIKQAESCQHSHVL